MRFSTWRWTRRRRRRGVARALLQAELRREKTQWFLEVRESNSSAIKLYESTGFREAGGGNRTIEIPPKRVLS